MNKKLLYAFMLGCISSLSLADQGGWCNPCDCKVTSQSFFSIRPVYQLNSPERLTLFQRNTLSQRNWQEDGGKLQLVALGGKSTKSGRIRRFFFPDCNDTLNVNEATNINDTNILANHLNIYTVNGVAAEPEGAAFSSIIKICPEHSFIGLGITYQQAITEFCDGRVLWFRLSSPILHVRNRVNLEECIIENGGGATPEIPGAVGSVTAAFKQPAFLFGRIDDCACDMRRTLLGDIEALLGYQIVNNDCCTLESYAGALFPTGNRPKGRYLFEAIVGHNKHYGVLFGSSLSIKLWECDDRMLDFALDVSGLYLFKRTEVRGVDQKNKPFSRYMQTYASALQAQEAADEADPLIALSLHTPGINLFTLPLTIHPGFSRTINWAVVYTHCALQAELGYNFYARQAECAELACRFNESAALKSLLGSGSTDSVQQIGDNFGNNNVLPIEDYIQNIITAADLNLRSAEMPGMLSHTIYGSLGYHCDYRDYPTLYGLGASYEFVGDNTGLNRWMVWGKIGVGF